jgi:HlyD family secretion protein
MFRRHSGKRWLGLALAAGAMACRAHNVALPVRSSASSASSTATGGLRVSRGEFRQRLILTGSLEAARADLITIPRFPTWQEPLQWIEADGIQVQKGQRVAELDNTSFISNLKEKETAAVQAEHDLAQEEADQSGKIAEKQFDLEQKKSDREKARIEAALPGELRSRRETQDKQLAFEKASVEADKAQTDLNALRTAATDDIANRRLTLEKARREIEVARAAIQDSTLRAPHEGILIIADNLYEGRKFQAGDQVYVGLSVASLPDLASLQVSATLYDVDDRRVWPGQTAEVVLDAYPDLTFPARIVEVAPVAQESASTSLRRGFRVIARVEHPDPSRMRPGLSARVVVFGERLRDVLLIPRTALDFSKTPARTQLSQGGTAPVRLGPCNSMVCVLEDGLPEGARLASATTRGTESP